MEVNIIGKIELDNDIYGKWVRETLENIGVELWSLGEIPGGEIFYLRVDKSKNAMK